MIKHLRLALTLAVSLCSGIAGMGEASSCRQALALGLDVSGSVSGQEYRLQLDGLAGALQDPEVKRALLSTPELPVHLMVFEWSAPEFQRVLLNWTPVNSPQTLARITQTLAVTQRAPAPPGTAVGTAVQFGVSQLAQMPDCWKHTLDLSGDGLHNMGPSPHMVKAELEGSAVIINGLVIGADSQNSTDTRMAQIGELVAYFQARVIHGPDAFVETALGFEDFQAAMTRKLLRELAVVVLSQSPPSHRKPAQ
ncbi:hypothetical protein TRL7639_03105 [Falsiruegeria litorea R37]|uniref:VWFA domain-containing protein n=1 Tax=Falsiruegeria litorea R37 TaxID=1200284 RepID=A0A1Y5T7R6_9RHOB|nr:DUF1194 domain-containing protein [Falsiruegeria litorea]SLN57332.1 hypothetical protein TRL7639_03105 [Falsiruegeria litorea R37]